MSVILDWQRCGVCPHFLACSKELGAAERGLEGQRLIDADLGLPRDHLRGLLPRCEERDAADDPDSSAAPS